jgi:uncharacterized surface anchored protein
MTTGKTTKIVVAVLAAAWAGLASAQNVTGQVVGRVTDSETGKAIAGATVTATSPGWIPQSVTTDARGNYVLTLLPPERYTVEVRAPGYQASSTAAVPVAIDWRVRRNVELLAAKAASGEASGPVASR